LLEDDGLGWWPLPSLVSGVVRFGPLGVIYAGCYAATARFREGAVSAGRSRMAPRFMRAREEQKGHSRLPSLMLLQSRQSTAWLRGIIAFLTFVIMMVRFLLIKTAVRLESCVK